MIAENKRFFLRGLAGCGLNMAFGNAQPVNAICRFPTTRSIVKSIFSLPAGSYFTYPHSNGFIDAETCLYAREVHDNKIEYNSFNLITKKSFFIGLYSGLRMYYSVSQDGVIAAPGISGLYLINYKTSKKSELIHWDGWKVLGGCDISADGTKVLVNRYDLKKYQLENKYSSSVDIVDCSNGNVSNVFRADFPLDHAHFSPYDPSWVFFCDGSVHSRQRMWVWHADNAPNARNIFKQTNVDGTWFEIGHERASFHKLSLMTVAYSSSSATPRGLYEIGFNGDGRCVSEGNSDSHCNVSRDGRWAVVSTLSAVRSDSNFVDVCERSASDWIRSDVGYVTSDILVVNVKSGIRQHIFRGSNAVSKTASIQPYEAQPSISPDGRWILVKDAKTRRIVAIEVDQVALSAFLDISV